MHVATAPWIALALTACATASAAARQTPAPDRIRVFLDCNACDSEYVRTEVPWVDYVLDRQSADVHVLVTTQSTGAGGREHTFFFLGRGRFEAKSDTLRYTSPPDATADVRRQGQTRVFKSGLVRYLADSSLAPRLQITVSEPVAGATSVTPARDPWNGWVFSTSGSGYISSESQQSYESYGLSLSANRTTAQWKLRNSVRGNYNENSFEVDSVTTITSLRRSYSGNVLVVKTLGTRWSAGVQATAESSTFGNVELSLRVSPALEYDFFPYAESTRRLFTLLYTAGVSSYDYRETTIYGRTEEVRPVHGLTASYATRQPWGSTGLAVSASQYLDDTSKYRWSASGNGSVRLFRGLSLNTGLFYSRVRDQLAVPAGDATRDEILLRQRLLRTSFFYGINFGVSYRFGSIFSPVVNRRIDQGIGGDTFFVEF